MSGIAVMNKENRIATDMARYKEYLAEAEAGDPYARMNADAYAARLKRLGAVIPGATPPVAAAAAAPKPAPAPKAAPQLPVTREVAIKRIGAAHDVPPEMTAAAIADGTSAADFAVAVADYVTAQAREAEIDAIARRIVDSYR